MTRLLLPIILLLGLNSYSQFTISGKVVDTGENRALHNAVVSLISPEDSILIRFTRTSEDGTFSIKNVEHEKILLLITYPGYADFVDQLSISTNEKPDLGNIPLTRKSELLEAVIVQRRLAAIRMRGDTLAFLADSFAVRQGATVDELLKQLPGIQVDRNGAITAQGEKVNKVLVDGEEFFSDDPAVVTKSLQAEAVKEVQVFDKKSEQAEFTGIDDGERSKTINLMLKPEKKKGYFGKATINGGTNESFDNDLMLNYFKGTRKFAAFGIMSNVGRQGLDWSDMERFGGGNDVQRDEEEGYFYSARGDDDFSQDMNYEDGLPAAWSAGLHFSDKWNKDRSKINGNYRFLKKNLSTEGTTTTQYILPDTQYFSDRSSKAFNSRIGHQVKAISEVSFDSLSNIKITLRGNVVRNENASRQVSRALNADSGLVNTNKRLLSSLSDKNNFFADILYRKKFKKVGRTISVDFSQRSGRDELEGLLQSSTLYFNSNGNAGSEENIDQQKNNSIENFGVTSKAVYTEPLTKDLYLSVNYGINYALSSASRNSFNKGSSGFYDKRDSLFSNDFDFRYLIQSTGADLRFNKKKLTVLVGSGFNFANFRQTDKLLDSSRKYNFTNIFPKLLIRFSPRQYSGLTLRYNGRNNPPTLEQLQPVQENTDPLNIRLGNPSLRQEFVHNASFNFHSYQVISERGAYLSVSASVYDNAISTSSTVDAGGKTFHKPINVDGNFSGFAYAGYQMKLKKLNLYFNIGLDMQLNRTINELNNLRNINNYQNYGLYMYLGKQKNDKYSLSLRGPVGYTFSKSSLRPDIVTRFVTFNPELDGWIKLPAKFEVGTNVQYAYREQTDVFQVNRNVVRWNAHIARKFLKNNNLELKVQAFDILDQNIGFRRTATSNFITEDSYTTLRRRFMIGIQYNISKNP